MDDILFSGNLLVRVAGETETARESKIAPKSLQNKCKTWQKAWQKKKKKKKKEKKKKKRKEEIHVRFFLFLRHLLPDDHV